MFAFFGMQWSELFTETIVSRKDDYAFFLNPVDPAAVPGYSDVVKIPMDFGTMTAKVEAGRYRSLEQFKVCIAPQRPFTSTDPMNYTG